MEKHGWIIIIFITLLIVVAGEWLHSYFMIPKTVVNLSSNIHSEQQSRVLVIDLHASSTTALSEVFSPEDAMIVVHRGSSPFDRANDVVFTSEVLLALFDQNHDGRIDANDSVYKNLELKSFKNGIAQYTPVNTVGIKSIYIDPKYNNQENIPEPIDNAPQPVGTAILTDGTARLIRDMSVDDYYLQTQPFESK